MVDTRKNVIYVYAQDTNGTRVIEVDPRYPETFTSNGSDGERLGTNERAETRDDGRGAIIDITFARFLWYWDLERVRSEAPESIRPRGSSEVARLVRSVR